MENRDYQYGKRTQKDYSMSFKLPVVKEVESGFISKRGAMRKYGIQGHGTITEWCRKYGNFDSFTIKSSRYMKTPEQMHLQKLVEIKTYKKSTSRKDILATG